MTATSHFFADISTDVTFLIEESWFSVLQLLEVCGNVRTLRHESPFRAISGVAKAALEISWSGVIYIVSIKESLIEVHTIC
jgi:hypothetical protein